MSQIPSGMPSDDVLVVERSGPIVTVALNRPEQSNAIDGRLRDGLLRMLDELAADRSVRALVLTSAGEDAFSVGMDVSELATLAPESVEAAARKGREVCERLTSLPIPVLAAIKGACLGAGFELALHADVRLARADARFGFPGINVGMTSGGAGLARLQRISGIGSAAALALTGGVVTADRAFMLGLVSNVASDADFWPSVQQLATHFTTLSPVAALETKRLLKLAAESGIAAASEASPAALARCFSEGDARTRLQMMLSGRDPEATVH